MTGSSNEKALVSEHQSSDSPLSFRDKWLARIGGFVGTLVLGQLLSAHFLDHSMMWTFQYVVRQFLARLGS